jgi:pimeloyl-CoA dehydrogenase small subunit
MDFDLTSDQQLLRDGLDRLLAERYTFEQRKNHLASPEGWSQEMWRRYAEMGLLALPFAEEDGGLGAGPVESMLVSEAFGRALVLEPWFATMQLAGACLRLSGPSSARSELIPRIAAGELLAAFAHVERQARYDLADVATTARREAAGWVLEGHKPFVLHGDCAEKLIVSARISGQQRDRTGIALFVVDASAPGVARRGYAMQDGLRAAELRLSNVRVPENALLGVAGEAFPVIQHVVDTAIASLCAEAVGAMTRAHEITVEYLKARKQFGSPIGSFQALQHRAVDMLVAIEQARSLTLYATMMLGTADPSERTRAVSAAKVQVGRTGKYVGEQAIQLHGGIGVTEECAVGHYYRRLTMIDILFGDSAHHLTALARAGSVP